MPLDYTPRKFVTHPENNYFYLVEGDNRTLGEGAAQEKIQKLVRPSLIHISTLLKILCRGKMASTSTMKLSTYHPPNLVALSKLQVPGLPIFASLTLSRTKLSLSSPSMATKACSPSLWYHSLCGTVNCTWLWGLRRIRPCRLERVLRVTSGRISL